MKYKKRAIEPKIKRLAELFPVVVVTGARQVGKTTLLRHLFPAAQYVVFDPVSDWQNARSDPELFLKNLKKPAILDEIQYVPELLPVIKRMVDESPEKGQFFLTGSQNLGVLKNVTESLAGRAALTTLSPMTLGELEGQPSNWVVQLLKEKAAFFSSDRGRVSHQREVFELMWRGGYPGLADTENDFIQDSLESYFRTYIERDVRLVSEVSDLQEFSRFIRVCAHLTSQEINQSHLGRELNVTPQTARRWLDVLAATSQWVEVEPYSGNVTKRISGKRKGYFIDSGMVSYLSHISSPQALGGHPVFGAVFESYVVCDMIRQIEASALKPGIYHWRSHGGAEVDLILEIDGIYFPVEIKCRSMVSRRDLRGIEAFRKTYPNLNIGPGLVVYAGENLFSLSEDCYAVPFDCT